MSKAPVRAGMSRRDTNLFISGEMRIKARSGVLEIARSVVIMLAAFMLASIVLVGIEKVTAAPYHPPLEVYLDDNATKQATVTNDQNGSVVFKGAIHVYYLVDERTVLDLSVAVDSSWESSVFPNRFIINQVTQYQFNVTVIVPQATLANIVGHVKVTAITSGGDRENTTDFDMTVTVAPYYNLALGSDDLHKEINPKEGHIFNFKVKNLGNSVDSYQLGIVNARNLSYAGWSFEIHNETIACLPPKGERNVSVTVRPPQDWSWDIWIDRSTPIVLNATSLVARINNVTLTQSVSVSVNVKGYNNPLLGMITTIILLAAMGVSIFAIVRWRRKKGKQSLVKEKP